MTLDDLVDYFAGMNQRELAAFIKSISMAKELNRLLMLEQLEDAEYVVDLPELRTRAALTVATRMSKSAIFRKFFNFDRFYGLLVWLDSSKAPRSYHGLAAKINFIEVVIISFINYARRKRNFLVDPVSTHKSVAKIQKASSSFLQTLQRWSPTIPLEMRVLTDNLQLDVLAILDLPSYKTPNSGETYLERYFLYDVVAYSKSRNLPRHVRMIVQAMEILEETSFDNDYSNITKIVRAAENNAGTYTVPTKKLL